LAGPPPPPGAWNQADPLATPQLMEAEEELCTSTTSTEAGERLVMAIFYRIFIRTLSSL